MNPYPFVGLNHFTVPVATSASSVARARYRRRPNETRIAVNLPNVIAGGGIKQTSRLDHLMPAGDPIATYSTEPDVRLWSSEVPRPFQDQEFTLPRVRRIPASRRGKRSVPAKGPKEKARTKSRAFVVSVDGGPNSPYRPYHRWA